MAMDDLLCMFGAVIKSGLIPMRHQCIDLDKNTGYVFDLIPSHYILHYFILCDQIL
jgi:hypothetical protein